LRRYFLRFSLLAILPLAVLVGIRQISPDFANKYMPLAALRNANSRRWRKDNDARIAVFDIDDETVGSEEMVVQAETALELHVVETREVTAQIPCRYSGSGGTAPGANAAYW
jgi:hypothetical protein